MADKTNIQKFYADQTIFVTGGTGFIGKLVIEKLLRLCFDLKVIYLLVRPKWNKNSEQRFHEMFQHSCFNRLKSEEVDFKDKIKLIEGDCSKINLGLCDQDAQLLKNQVNIIFHIAADVKFNQELNHAAYSNVRAVRSVLHLAKESPNLKALVHVSTAYSACPKTYIEEKFYKPGMTCDSLLSLVESVDEDTLKALTPSLIGKWPNTYTYTKCIAEDLIRTEADSLPLAIVRPAIIASTAKEPFPGWVDNFYGLIGVAAGVLLGAIKIIHGNKGSVLHTVPCDYVVSLVLASAWALGQNNERDSDIPIYNYSGHNSNLLTLGVLERKLNECRYKFPLNNMLWYSNFTITKSTWWYQLRSFFQHTMTSYIVDFFLILFRQKPIVVQKYAKVNKLLKMLSYFALGTWHFDTRNVDTLWYKMQKEDQDLFEFSMEKFDWELMWDNSVHYGRVYLLNDPLETLPKARMKVKVFAVVHYLFVTVFIYFVCKFVYSTFTYIFH